MSFLVPKAPKMASPPPVPDPQGSPEDEARRRELAAQARAGGRQGSILTEYALATTPAPTLRATLGGQ